MSLLVFFLVLFVLVLVHELGHFIAAKRFGMRVDEFGIGFPPRLFGVRKGETEYTFNLFPIGGFVKIYGEDIDAAPDASAGDAFTSKSKMAQSLVLLAGITMNILFAWLLFSVALAFGVETSVSEIEAGSEARLMVTDVLPGSPAERAGIPEGASITGISSNGTKLVSVTPTTFREFVGGSAGEELIVMYEYRGDTRTAPLVAEPGIVDDSPNSLAVGVALTFVEVVAKPIHIALYEGTLMTLTTLRDITLGIGGLIYDAVLLRADLSQVAGPVGIVGLVGEASAFGFTTLMLFTAFISLNLAVINVLPFPALDGGRLLFVIIEAVKRGPLDSRYVHALNTIGFVLLILLMATVTWNDIARIL